MAKLAGHEPCLADGLARAADSDDWDAFERYVIAGSQHPSPLMAPVLREVLDRRLRINTEDILDLLALIRDPEAVSVVEGTLWWMPDWDDYYNIGIKAVWALADIATPAAYDVLRDVVAVGPDTLRDWATRLLERAGQPLN